MKKHTKKVLKVEYTTRAKQAIRDQAQYLRSIANSPKSAIAFRKEIKKSEKRIQQAPKGYQTTEYSKEVRVYPENRFNTYVFYRIEEDSILILDIRGQAQSTENGPS